MAEFIGAFIANWPVWIALPLIIVVAGVWMYVYATTGLTPAGSRHEWPEDKKQRLADKELNAKKTEKN